MDEPTFEDVIGAGICRECGWTLTLHSPSCMAEVPAVEYLYDKKIED